MKLELHENYFSVNIDIWIIFMFDYIKSLIIRYCQHLFISMDKTADRLLYYRRVLHIFLLPDLRHYIMPNKNLNACKPYVFLASGLYS